MSKRCPKEIFVRATCFLLNSSNGATVGQDFEDLELIIVNGVSTDATKQISNAMQSRIRELA
jgi:cellulose synthase/poly-beta-1,6-N-acetylglucosamine synthase-like glycosyltransferase